MAKTKQKSNFESELNQWIEENHERETKPNTSWKTGQSQYVSYHKKAGWKPFSSANSKRGFLPTLLSILGLLIAAKMFFTVAAIVLSSN